MTREAFLSRVRAAARQGQAYRVARHPIPPGTGYVGVARDLVEAMVDEVRGVGGRAQRVADLDEAAARLADLCQQFQVRRTLVWDHPVLERMQLRERLKALGIEAIDAAMLESAEPAEARRLALEADLGITSADWGIAETGTLVMRARRGRERMSSLLPPVHVAILERAQLVPDLLDVFATLGAEGLENLPSNVTLITGPSKTGDIELQLTTGVHGPGEWHVLVAG